MSKVQKKQAALEFVQNWQGHGYEKGEAQTFWNELLRDVLGFDRISQRCKFEYRVSSGGFIDCLIPDSGVLVEQKSQGTDLDKPEERQGRKVTPFEQALSYAEDFPQSQQPRFIIVCSFDTFRVYDRNLHSRSELASNFIEFSLEDLASSPHLLDFITDPENSRAEKEKQVSIRAGELIGKLFAALRNQYLDPDSPESQHALNVLCVRLVFCLFCEDAGLFEKDAFLKYLRKTQPRDMRRELKDLFVALNTPVAERDPYDDRFRDFPYVNGGLFAGDYEIPNFTEELQSLLLLEISQKTDWSQISPTIFGGIFESTLNPETRHAGGMHYTSPENIHRVIDPLFLDALYRDFDKIRQNTELTLRKRKALLREFHARIASLNFFDPACGSGNFLTETYRCLRELEDDVLHVLQDGQTAFAFAEDEENMPRVSLSQFYGVEINGFAVSVATTALWIARLQANHRSAMLQTLDVDDFPLVDTPNIVQGNALRMDWEDVLPAAECSYIMGNPPFLGSSVRSAEQTADMEEIAFSGAKKWGKIDYCGAWYYMAAKQMARNKNVRAAFVSTNSLCQGEQVEPMWKPLFDAGISIDFAWRTFVWNNEASDQAKVHCVIVGFSRLGLSPVIYHNDGSWTDATTINGYLLDAPVIFVQSRGKPIGGKSLVMTQGNKPVDGGNLILSVDEAQALISKYDNLSEVIHPYIGGREFINGERRFCLWFVGKKLADYNYPEIRERIEGVIAARESSPTKAFREAAATPHLFMEIRQPENAYLAIPEVSSERRKYIPVGFIDSEVIASNQLRFIPTDSKYVLGLLLSAMHMAWMRVVAGRLEMRYRYSPAVFNSFVFPQCSKEQQDHIAQLAQQVLDARDLYPESSLAKLYDPDNEWCYPELIAAHRALDAAVEDAYGVRFAGDEEKIVAHLFKLYAEASRGE